MVTPTEKQYVFTHLFYIQYTHNTIFYLMKCIGFHGYRNGFDALISADLLDEIPPELETEKASIDEILVYIAKEDKNERASQDTAV